VLKYNKILPRENETIKEHEVKRNSVYRQSRWEKLKFIFNQMIFPKKIDNNLENLTISQKIKNDYGTLVFFCKKHEINLHTFKRVLYGYGTSTRIANLLIKLGYIKCKDELRKTKKRK